MTKYTEANFDASIAAATTPVLVDFYTESCGPCRAMSPIIDKLATEYAGKVEVVKVLATDALDTCRKLAISTVPTLILYKDGQIDKRSNGYMTEKQLREVLESAIA